MVILFLIASLIVGTTKNQAAVDYDAGLRAASHQQISLAIEHFQQAVQIDPDLSDAHFRLGLIFTNHEQWRRAIQSFGKAIMADPNYLEARYRLGEAYLVGTAQAVEAAEQLKSVIAADPNHLAARQLLGQAHLRLHQPELAVAILEKAQSADPTINYDLGLARYRTADLQGAVDSFQQVVSVQPNHVQAHFHLAQCYRQLGQGQKSKQSLHTFELLRQQADQIANLQQYLAVDSSNARAWAQLGRLFLRQEAWTEAISAFQNGVTHQPTEASFCEQLGYAYMKNQDYSSAQLIFQELTQRYPQSVEYRNSLGISLAMQNLLPEAISQFETARQLDPTDPQIHFNLYRFYQKTGDRRRAQQAFQRYQQLQ